MVITLHDKLSYEQKRRAGYDEWTGEIAVDFRAGAANSSDVKMQLIQTIKEAEGDELVKIMENMEVRLD